MVSALVRGAFLGDMFEELLRVVSEAKGKARFVLKSRLDRLEFNLRLYVLRIKQIDKYNEQLNLPKKEKPWLVEVIQVGERLVHKCSRIKWNYMKMIYYAAKLLQLNSRIDNIYQIEMQAEHFGDRKEILHVVRELQEQITGFRSNGNNGEKFFKDIILRPCSVPDPPDITPGLDVPVEDLKKELLRDGMEVIVVSASQGAGKTTLVKKLCKDEQIEGKFKDNMIFFTVSKLPNVKIIARRMFQHLGKNVPDFQTDEHAMKAMERLLKELGAQPILLILDDVWSGSEYLVQNFKFQLPNYKILVTSRSVLPELGFGYKLKPLNDKYASTLFYHSATRADEDCYIPDQDILNEILRVCQGSPLALTEVGRSLCGQPGIVWRARVEKWTRDPNLLYSKIFPDSKSRRMEDDLLD